VTSDEILAFVDKCRVAPLDKRYDLAVDLALLIGRENAKVINELFERIKKDAERGLSP